MHATGLCLMYLKYFRDSVEILIPESLFLLIMQRKENFGE